VWFGENVPTQEMREAERLGETAALLVCVGASEVVFPAA
jgi:NAD-dependent SIR2 family protein deacetylase